MVTDQGTYASLPDSRIESMDSGNAKFKISGGGKYQVRNLIWDRDLIIISERSLFKW